ncbi:hypothetical protein MTO96_051764 [Rhipicephalus appendiculatus]
MILLAVFVVVVCWPILSWPVCTAYKESDPQITLLDRFRRLLSWSAVNGVTPASEDSVEDDDYPDDQAKAKAENEPGIVWRYSDLFTSTHDMQESMATEVLNMEDAHYFLSLEETRLDRAAAQHQRRLSDLPRIGSDTVLGKFIYA